MAGGIAFRGTLPDLYRANLQLRTVNRVLVRLGDFPAPSFPELRRRAAALAWERFLRPGGPVALRVACHRSRLYHQQAVAERVAGAIGDRLGQAPPVQKWSDDEDRRGLQLVLVRVADNHCTVSLDSSGPLLHRRGYRLAGAKAPLRETLAAGLVLASGWDGVSPLLDPFCGCGTTVCAAQKLGRRWLGIDITHLSIALQKYRLREMFPDIQFQVIGEPEDVASAIAWLLDPAQSWVTGQVIGVDGGLATLRSRG